MRATFPAYFILLDLITLIIYDESYNYERLGEVKVKLSLCFN
jgi:hypothetical protein